MVTRYFENCCIFAVFLRYFKFPSVKVFKNLVQEVEQYTKKIKGSSRINFLDICNFLF